MQLQRTFIILIIKMISRLYRKIPSNLNQPIYPNTQTHVNRSMISNEDIYFILQMHDLFKKCKNDATWLDRCDQYNEEVVQSKIALSHTTHKKNDLKKSLELYSVQLHETNKVYFEGRIEEVNFRINAIISRMQNTRYKLYGFLYFPLIICMENIMRFHEKHDCVEKKCFIHRNPAGKWNLSFLLLTILKCSNFKLFEFDQSDAWNEMNIFAHPIIAMCDERVDNIMQLPHYNPNTRDYMIEHSVGRVFGNFEPSYLKQILKELILIYYFLPEKFPSLVHRVMDPRGCGQVIFNFLIGDTLCEHLLVSMNIFKKRKRNCDY
jgi:hypothetical protein